MPRWPASAEASTSPASLPTTSEFNAVAISCDSCSLSTTRREQVFAGPTPLRWRFELRPPPLRNLASCRQGMVGVNGYFFLSHFHHRECGRALRSLRGKLHARFNIHVIWKPIPGHSEHGLRVRLSVSLLWFHRHFKALAFLHTIQGSF